MGKQSGATAFKREATWRDRMARQAGSGQSVEVFCKNEGVSAWSFYRWRKLLGVSMKPSKAVVRKLPVPFVDLGSMPAPQVPTELSGKRMPVERAGGVEIRIDLGGGVMLTVVRH